MLHHSSSGKLIKAARQEAGNCSTQKGDERCNYSKSVGWNQASTCQWTHFLWSARSFTKSRCCSCGICWKKQAFFYCHLKCQFQGLKLMAVGMDLQLFLKCRCLLQSAPVWNPYVSKRLTVAVFDSFRWGFCCEECCIEMHWPFAWSHVGLQFNVVLGVFEVLHFGVRSSELSHFDLQINRKVWDSGKLSHSNQLRLLELLLSSLVMWHVFFFFLAAPYSPYNMPCTEVLAAIAFGKAYTLTVLSDIGAFPRPGENGRLTARQGLWPDLKDVSKMKSKERTIQFTGS